MSDAMKKDRPPSLAGKILASENYDGKKDFAYVQGLKGMNEILSQDEWHVGIAPLGSRSVGLSQSGEFLKGTDQYDVYPSDYDYIQIVDHTRNRNWASHETKHQQIQELNRRLGTAFGEHSPREISAFRVFTSWIDDMREVRKIRKSAAYSSFLKAASALFRPCVGRDIETWRTNLAVIIHTQSTRERAKIIGDITTYLVDQDFKKFHKHQYKTQSSKSDIMQARTELWKNRVEKVFNRISGEMKPEQEKRRGYIAVRNYVSKFLKNKK